MWSWWPFVTRRELDAAIRQSARDFQQWLNEVHREAYAPRHHGHPHSHQHDHLDLTHVINALARSLDGVAKKVNEHHHHGSVANPATAIAGIPSLITEPIICPCCGQEYDPHALGIYGQTQATIRCFCRTDLEVIGNEVTVRDVE